MAESTTTDTTSSANQDLIDGIHQNGHRNPGEQRIEHLEDDRVLIAGGGPVGLVLATTLSSYGIKSLIVERNATTTK